MGGLIQRKSEMVKGNKRRHSAAGITAAEPKRVSGVGAVPPRSRVKLCVCRFVESGDVRPYSAERRRGPRKSASKASGFWGNRSDADLYILYGRTSHGHRVFAGHLKVILKSLFNLSLSWLFFVCFAICLYKP